MRTHRTPRLLRALVGVAVATLLAWGGGGGPRAEAYYEESHLTGDDVRLAVEASGVARIEHLITWRVVAGQPRTIDLVGVEPGARPEPTASVEADDGRVLPASVAMVPGRGLRVTVTEPKAVHHGQQYRLKVAYTVNLVEAGELTREATDYRLLWRAPVLPEGLEGPKVTFLLPAALEAPAALVGEGAMRDDGVVATVKRTQDHDEIELMRPHVGRGEEVLWAVRIAARAFDAGSPALAAPPPPPRHDEPAGPAMPSYALAAVLAAALAWAVHRRATRFDALGHLAGARPRGLVCVSSRERAALAGSALFVGLSLQLVDAPLAGALAIVVAMVCSVVRAPRAQAETRGPGRWLLLRPEEAFVSPRSGTARGKLVTALGLSLALAGLVAAGRLLASLQPEARLFLPLDAVVLLPLLGSGLASQLPPDRVSRGARWLARCFRRIQATRSLRASPWARVPTGLARPDEVRVLVVPREPMPGLSGIEIGLAWGHAATSFVAAPEVLVRVHEATAAAARMTTLAPSLIPVPGRKPEERVYRLLPRFPTCAATVALVESLGNRLVDRRVVERACAREDRRIPPEERARAEALAVQA